MKYIKTNNEIILIDGTRTFQICKSDPRYLEAYTIAISGIDTFDFERFDTNEILASHGLFIAGNLLISSLVGKSIQIPVTIDTPNQIVERCYYDDLHKLIEFGNESVVNHWFNNRSHVNCSGFEITLYSCEKTTDHSEYYFTVFGEDVSFPYNFKSNEITEENGRLVALR